MKRQVIVSLAAVCSIFLNSQAVFADTTAAGAGTKSSSSSSSSSARKSPSASEAPAMIAGVLIGSAVGWPICFVRRFKHDEMQGTRGIVGESDNKLLLVPAGFVWLPFAAFTSFVEAPVYAIRNSWMADKPFSKEQFSLGDMPEYD